MGARRASRPLDPRSAGVAGARPVPAHGHAAALRRAQASAGNRVTARALGRRSLQRQPTIDLAALYTGRGDPTVVADFVRLQTLLSDRHAATPHLRRLSDALQLRLDRAPLPRERSPAASEAASALLDDVLASFEIASGFSAERPVLVGFASAEDFQALTLAGQHFHDVGAGQLHGEFTHRIQWFIATSAITGGAFDGRAHAPFTHTARELYAASMDEAYAVDAVSVSGKGYMWDWVVDRIAGMYPTALGKTADYVPGHDAWTHPGETGQQGALSNDILSGGLVGIDALTFVRQRQLEGYGAGKAEMTSWFDVAVELHLAEGKAFGTGAPSYFRRGLIPRAEAMRRLRDGKFFAAGLIDRVCTWAGLTPLSMHPTHVNADLVGLDALNREAVRWWSFVKDTLSEHDRGPLTLAMVDAWFGGLMEPLQLAYGRLRSATTAAGTDKATVARVAAQLEADVRAIKDRASWRIVA